MRKMLILIAGALIGCGCVEAQATLPASNPGSSRSARGRAVLRSG